VHAHLLDRHVDLVEAAGRGVGERQPQGSVAAIGSAATAATAAASGQQQRQTSHQGQATQQ